MAPWTTIFRVVSAFENHIVAAILRRPGWHRFVGGIRNRVEDYRYGRDPNEPLRPGEATANPDRNGEGGFMRYFVDELKNQVKGRPTENMPPPPPPPKRQSEAMSTPDPFAEHDRAMKR